MFIKKPKTITLHYPTHTLPVSVTGTGCGLACRHCTGHYLHGMKTLADVSDIDAIPKKITGFLMSGGCTSTGAVPLGEHAKLLKKLKDAGYRLNLHTGLLSSEDIQRVVPLADTVSFDFLTDDETIRQVFGIDRTGRDYMYTYSELKRYARVIPHITIGLLGGQVSGEYHAVMTLSCLGCDRIVFLAFIPTKGTPFEKAPPPPLEDVTSLFQYAREKLPETPFGLGCMHPRGKYKQELEMLAFEYGFDSFVNPSRKFYSFLKERAADGDINLIIARECCTL